MPASIPPPSGQLIFDKIFDAAVSGTVPAGTMVSLTPAGTIIDKVAPAGNQSSVITISATTTNSYCPCDMGGQKFVVAYLDTTNGSKITLIAGSVSGGTITVGSPVVGSNSTSGTFHVCKLSTSLGLIYYNDSTNGLLQNVAAFSLSGVTLTLGAGQAPSTSGDNSGVSLWATSASTFMILFQDSANSFHLTAVAGSVSGTTVSVGAKVQITTVNTSNANIAVLTATSFVVVWKDTANSSKMSAVAGSLSGNTITLGAAAVGTDTGNSSQIPFIAVMDSTHFAFISSQLTNTLIFGVVSGNTVTLGSPITGPASGNIFNYIDAPGNIIMASDSTHIFTGSGCATRTGDTTATWSAFATSVPIFGIFFVSTSLGIFQNALGGSNRSLSFVGTGAFSSTQMILNASTINVQRAITHSASRVIFVFNITGTGILAEIVDVYGPTASGTCGELGITLVAGSAGQSVPVVVAGIVGGFSGLTQASRVFADGAGVINTGGLGTPVGYALDSSTILLRKSLFASTIPVVLSP